MKFMADTQRGYHHGALKAALIDATLVLLKEGGIEAVSVREAAKRAGVSPGAPFRHFPSRTALLNAVAEEAMVRLTMQIDQALTQAASLSPLEQYRALGQAFLIWAFENPHHFQVISTRAVIDFEGSGLRASNDKIRCQMRQLLNDAVSSGELVGISAEDALLSTRALAYGLARMNIDGQLQSWDVESGNYLGLAQRLINEQIDRLKR